MVHECRVCGCEISNSDSIKRGMGSECFAAYQKALNKAVFSEMEKRGEGLKYNWLIAVGIKKAYLAKAYEGAKLRSAFKISFLQSVAKAERISSKQMFIIDQMLSEKEYLDEKGEKVYFEGGRDIYPHTFLTFANAKIKEAKAEMFNAYKADIKVTREALENARREIRAGKS